MYCDQQRYQNQPECITVDPCKALTIRGIKIDCNVSHKVATDGNEFCANSDTPLMVIPGGYNHNISVVDDLGQKAVVPFRVVTHDPDNKMSCQKMSIPTLC